MANKIRVDILNEVMYDTNILEGKQDRRIAILLVKERFNGYSILRMDMGKVDFSSKEKLEQFFDEVSFSTEEDSYMQYSLAKKEYDLMDAVSQNF